MVPFSAVAPLSAACGGERTTAAAETPGASAAAPVVDVAVVRATVGTVESALEISGTLAPRTRVGVKPKLPGRLERVLVDIGDRVTAGQVVATIDRASSTRRSTRPSRRSPSPRRRSKAPTRRWPTRKSNTRAPRPCSRAARSRASGSRRRETAHRAATAQRDLAKANLAQAQASLRRAREVQRDATLLSPVAGFVVERNYDAGAIPGDLPIVVVADLRQLKLEAGVSELEAGRLRTGLPAAVAVQAKPGEHFSGQLAAIAPEVDARNRHFQIEVRVDNSKGTLLAGMYATARIVLQAADKAITVPREAVTTRDGKRVVFKIDGDAVTPVTVTEGLNDGRRVQILSGLAAGDQVLADARRQLPAGSKVKAIAVN